VTTAVVVAGDVVADSRDVLDTRARSFSLASRLLPTSARDDAAVLYAVCRLADDLADDAPDDDTARRELDRLDAELAGDAPPRPVVRAWIELSRRRGIDPAPLRFLVATAREDLGAVRIPDRRGLLRYAYGVAGTVGLLMSSLLGATDARAAAHAVDLGVAMQITNICRDVLEDAGRGRVYLPANVLHDAGVEPDALVAGAADRAAVARVVTDLLALADRYYASGEAGARYLPWRVRFGVLAASRLYQRIGQVLVRRGADPLVGRTVVPGPERAWALLTALIVGARPPARPHDVSLHRALDGLPGIDASRRTVPSTMPSPHSPTTPVGSWRAAHRDAPRMEP
jgi:phytoene synthase